MAGGSGPVGGTSVRRRVTAVILVLFMLLAGYGTGWVAGNLSAAGDPVGAAAPSQETVQIAPSVWDAEADPNYYRVLGPAVVGEEPAAGTVAYGELDALGRATRAVALVTYDSMAAGLARQRGDLSSVEPSGWGHNEQVAIALPNGRIYHGYLYNRSHLVAKSLGGDDEPHNLITGTRTQNVGANVDGAPGGMAAAEVAARTWLDAHRDGTIYYAVTPLYEGGELVARSVIVDIRTSDGSIDQRLEVFNTVLGFDIDYATGAFEVTEDAQVLAERMGAQRQEADGDELADAGGESSAGEPAATGETGTDDSPEATDAEDAERLVVVTGSGKAYHHDESCRGLANSRTREWVSVSEAERMGRHPCAICGG